jgi:hypothetical protein
VSILPADLLDSSRAMMKTYKEAAAFNHAAIKAAEDALSTSTPPPCPGTRPLNLHSLTHSQPNDVPGIGATDPNNAETWHCLN